MRHITIYGLLALQCFSFPHYLISDTIFEKVVDQKMCILSLSTSLSETFLILRRTEREMIKKFMLVFMQIARYFCQILMKLEFSGQIFEKYSNMKIS